MQRENLIVPVVLPIGSYKEAHKIRVKICPPHQHASLITWTITQVYETYTSYNCGSRNLVLEIGLVSNSPGAK
jgi:hypothetical protein